MDLTNRQLFILSYLLNHPQGISGEHPASQVGVSVRTLQHCKRSPIPVGNLTMCVTERKMSAYCENRT